MKFLKNNLSKVIIASILIGIIWKFPFLHYHLFQKISFFFSLVGFFFISVISLFYFNNKNEYKINITESLAIIILFAVILFTYSFIGDTNI